jgi:alpha-D-ribose 1-methylphosphonate 5-phosphate C-P lyase
MSQEDQLKELAGLTWMKSRIPALDALVAFMPDGPRDQVIDDFSGGRSSRWYPEPGGHRVVILYETVEDYDATRFHVEKGAWDHEHCDLCGEHIPAMTLCWVTESGSYMILCEACHARVAEAAGTA